MRPRPTEGSARARARQAATTRSFYDCPLRAYLREHLGLENGTPLNLLTVIVRLSRNDRGHSWASLAYFGRCIERAARTVREALRELRSLGVVESRRTGRELHCTPVWGALGLDPENPAIPEAGAPRQAARAKPASEARARQSPAEERPDHETRTTSAAEAGANPATETCEPAPDTGTCCPAHAEQLAQVRDRFGVEAEHDVADVLHNDARATPDAARAALDRLLSVAPESVQRSVGAYFRRLLELAAAGRLAPSSTPTSPHSTPSAPPAASDAIDEQVKTQAERVQTLKREVARTDFSDERHRPLAAELNQAIDELYQLRTKQDARDQARDLARTKPQQTPRPPPPLRRTGPLPDWLAKFKPAKEACAPS